MSHDNTQGKNKASTVSKLQIDFEHGSRYLARAPILTPFSTLSSLSFFNGERFLLLGLGSIVFGKLLKL